MAKVVVVEMADDTNVFEAVETVRKALGDEWSKALTLYAAIHEDADQVLTVFKDKS